MFKVPIVALVIILCLLFNVKMCVARQEAARTLGEADEAAAWALNCDTASSCQLPANDGPGLNWVPDTQLSLNAPTVEQHKYLY